MKIQFNAIILFLFILLASTDAYCQNDTSRIKMSFDLGFSRGKDVNLLPLYRRIKSKEKKERDILFPFYVNKHDYVNHKKHSHLFPLYISDSTANSHDLRLLTLYYPSLIQISRRKQNDVHSFKLLELAPEINFLEYTRSTNGEYVQNNVFFFLWYNNNKTERTSHLVLFPLYWSYHNKDSYTNTLVPFYIAGTYHESHGKYFAVTPLFWHFKKNNTSFSYLFPLWLSETSGSGDNKVRYNALLPIYWSYKDRNENLKIIFPLLWSRKTLTSNAFTLFPLFSEKTYANKSKGHLMITPLFWQSHKMDKKTDVVGLLFWHRKKGDGEYASVSNTLFPIFYSHKDKNLDRKILLPIWYYKKAGSGDNAVYSNTIFPIYWSHKSKREEHEVLFPFMWAFKDANYSSYTIFPLFSSGHSPDSSASHLVITPFFWHFRKHQDEMNILFPFFYSNKIVRNDNVLHTNFIFPFFWHAKDRYSEKAIIFPLLWFDRNPQYNGITLFPLFSAGHTHDGYKNHLILTPFFWHWKTGDTHNTMLLPIYYAHKDNFRSSKVLFPIIWKYKDTVSSSLFVMLLFATGHSTDHATAFSVISPLFWHFKNHDNIHNVLFPLWWQSKKGSGDNEVKSNVIFPLYWSHKDKLSDYKIIFPLAWSLKNEFYKSLNLIPLFSAGHSPDGQVSHLAITPLFWHFRNHDNYHTVLFPIWWQSKKGIEDNEVKTNIIFPIYWSHKDKLVNNKIVFPFVWSLNNEFYKSFTFIPLFSSGHSPDGQVKHLAITPLFWHFKNRDIYHTVLFPLWWQSIKGSGDNLVKTNVIFPIYWSYKEKWVNNKIVFPFVWSLRNEFYKSFTFIPLFSSGHSPGGQVKHLAITPLFWHFKNKDNYTNILFPFWWQSKTGIGDNEVKLNVLFPIYWAYKDRWVNNKIVFPFAWKISSEYYKSFTFIPLFSTGHSPDGQVSHLTISPFFWHFKDHDIYHTVLFPFWWHSKNGIGENEATSNVIFPIYWSFKDKYKNNKIILPFIWDLRNEYHRSFTFIPFFSWGKSTHYAEDHLIITPIFWHFRRDDNYANVLFPLYWNFKRTVGNDASIWHVIFPLWWSVKSNKVNNKILLPIIWKFSNEHYSSFTLLPLLSFGHSPDHSRSHFVFTPLFWSIHKGDSKRITLFPLFTAHRIKKDVSDLKILYFLFHSHRDKDIRISEFLTPLCRFEKRTNYKYFRLAPFVWYKNSPKDKFFSIQPFFYRGRDTASKSLYIFWQLFTSRNIFHVKKSRSILWKAFYHDSYTNGDHETRLLYFAYVNMKKEGKEEHGIFPFYLSTRDTTGNHSFSLFFYFYNTFQRKIEGTHDFYREVDLFWFVRFRSNYRQLKAKGINEKSIRH